MTVPTVPSSLILTLQHAEQLDPLVRAELENIITGLQNWAGKFQLSGGNLLAPGIGTFRGQPRVKLFKNASQSIPDGVETLLTWDASANLSGSLEGGFDDFAMYDGGNYVELREPGIWLARCELTWQPNATGTRTIGIKPKMPAVDYLSRDVRVASSVTQQMQCVTLLDLIRDSPLGPTYAPFPLQLGVQVFQTSGGALNAAGYGLSTFSVWKLT